MSTLAAIGAALVGLSSLVVIVLVLRAMPRATFALWAVVMFFVPVWVGLDVRHLFLEAITAATLIAIAALGGDLRLSIVDLFVAILVLLAVVQTVIGVVDLSSAATTLLEWMLPYIWGRLVLSRVSPAFVTDIIATCAVIAAALALVEFATKTNIFTLVPFDNSLYEAWGTLQVRNGILRAEGAWGHSIALGAALAMSSSFILASRWRPVVRILALVLIAGATTMTLSRIGLLTLVLVVVLTIVLLPGIGRTIRIVVTAAGALGSVVIVPIIGKVLAGAGDEASGSADYRSTLFSLFRYVRLFGSAQSFKGATVGGDYLGSFAKSIDNTVLLTGLRLGWFALAMFCLIVALVIIPAFSPRWANPASIAITATAPSLFAVALITQFGMYFWFLTGLAVAWQVMREDESAWQVMREDHDAQTASGAGRVGPVHFGEDEAAAPVPSSPPRRESQLQGGTSHDA